MRHLRGTWIATLALAGLLGTAPGAGAAVDLGDPAGPLTNATVGPDLGCQAQHLGDETSSFTGCGTFVAVGGQVYGPGMAGSTLVSQAPQGRDAVATTVDLIAPGIKLIQHDSYLPGQDAWRTDVTVRNTSGAPRAVVLYRAGDCHLQSTGTGYGFSGSPNGAVGCSSQPGNSPLDRVIQWVPITAGMWMQGSRADVWGQIASGTPFANACVRCFEETDGAAGLSWSFTLAPGGEQTRSHWTVISPVGRTGPPLPVPPKPTPPVTTTVPGGQIKLTGPPGCVKPPARYRLRVTSIRKKRISKDRFGWKRRVRIHRVEFFVDGKKRRTDRRAAFKALLSSKGAAPGEHALKVRVVLQPLRSKGRQKLVGKKFRRTLKSAVHVCP